MIKRAVLQNIALIFLCNPVNLLRTIVSIV